MRPQAGPGEEPPAEPSLGAGASAPLLRARGVRYRYADAPDEALAGVDFSVARGEFVAVLGANGSGKSTLARLLSGLLPPSAGAVEVAGADLRRADARGELRRRVGLVFQNPDNQIVAALVEDDVAFGPENLGAPPGEITERVAAALAAVGMSEHARRDPHHLSGGQKQRVAIAGVLAMRPDCLCLDEPTSLLDPAGRAEVLAALSAVHAKGAAVVLITHHAAEAVAADRVVVLARGRVVADAAPADLFADPARLRAWGIRPPAAVAAWAALCARGLGLPRPCLTIDALAAELVRARPASGAAPPPPGFPAPAGAGAADASPAPRPAAVPDCAADQGLALERVRFTYPDPAVPAHIRRPAVDAAELRLRPGECVALIGATGSGKSTLALLACGLIPPEAGTVCVDGIAPWGLRRRRRRAALRSVRRLAGLVFQHPEDQFFEERVLDEVAFAPRNYGASAEQAVAAARDALRRAGLPADLAARSPFQLSGGQMRRVAIAALLAAEPRYLLLDEPTAGLDADGRATVVALVRSLRGSGVGILLITHRMDEAAALADRAVVVQGGQVVAAGSVREVFALGPRLSGWGLEPPPAAELLAALRACGWSVPPFALTLQEAVEAIASCAGAQGTRPAGGESPQPAGVRAGGVAAPGEGGPQCSHA